MFLSSSQLQLSKLNKYYMVRGWQFFNAFSWMWRWGLEKPLNPRAKFPEEEAAAAAAAEEDSFDKVGFMSCRIILAVSPRPSDCLPRGRMAPFCVFFFWSLALFFTPSKRCVRLTFDVRLLPSSRVDFARDAGLLDRNSDVKGSSMLV